MDKEKGGKPLYLLKCLLIAYILTAGLLFLLALLVYKLHISEKMVSAIVIVIYIAVNFTAGFFTGKHMQTRKFLWGLLMGTAYFVVLAIAGSVCGKRYAWRDVWIIFKKTFYKHKIYDILHKYDT